MSVQPPTVAVVGVGTMGALAFWQLAERGIRVIGYESRTPAHPASAGAGGSRMFREVTTDGAALDVQTGHARALWERLAARSGDDLIVPTGALSVGSSDSALVRGSIASAERRGVPHQILSPAEIEARFPLRAHTDGEVGVYEPGAATIRSDAAVIAAARLGVAAGGELRTHTAVTAIESRGSGVRVHSLTAGDARADDVDAVIVSAGTGTAGVIPGAGRWVEPRHTATHVWFPIEDETLLVPGRLPATVRDLGGGDRFGAMPALDGRNLKIGAHRHTAPDAMTAAELEADGIDAATELVRAHFDGVVPFPVAARSYTESYALAGSAVVDWIDGPDSRQVVMAGFSGIGFKRAPALAAHAVAMVLGETADPPNGHAWADAPHIR